MANSLLYSASLLILVAIAVHIYLRSSTTENNLSLEHWQSRYLQFSHVHINSNDNSPPLHKASNDTIAYHLRQLTLFPHVAGTPQNVHDTAHYVLSAFREYGLDAHYRDYEVLLSYPISRSLSLELPNGEVMKASLTEDEQGDDVIPSYHAYSPSGDVVSESVYVNYGRQEDYDMLLQLGVDVRGAIAIARYGMIYRGDIVTLAAKAGAAAVLIYSDPFDYGVNGTQGFYPDSKWLPPTGLQRGTVMLELGDPLTPGWTSTHNSERLSMASISASIPSLPISAADALPILQSLSGPVAPADWHGALDITNYHVGRGPSVLHFSYLENRTMATIRNVFGVIRGSLEPDRYVLLGNHRDAWTFGAVDPNSGTAALLEVARRFGQLKKQGWQPKRSIYLCNWDAEEFGLIGSTEWVEENEKLLHAKAIAYINVDMAVSGSEFSASATPQLDTLLKTVTSKVKDPDLITTTIYDNWIKLHESSPLIERLGGTGSDYAPFVQHIGVPSIDFLFGGGYPVYHSTYDCYDWVQKFADPLFHRHVAVVDVWGLLALNLVDADILPFDYEAYAAELQIQALALTNDLEKAGVSKNVTADPILSAISQLKEAYEFITSESKVLVGSPNDLRMINERLALAERAFLDVKGLPRGIWYQHQIFGPTTNDDYGSTFFPGVQDTIREAKSANNASAWADVQHQIWRVARSISHAALVLRGELT